MDVAPYGLYYVGCYNHGLETSLRCYGIGGRGYWDRPGGLPGLAGGLLGLVEVKCWMSLRRGLRR
jgi:hypothetical protein